MEILTSFGDGGRQPGQFSKQLRKASGRTMKRSSRNRRLTLPTISRLARREELFGFSREFKQLFSRRNEADFWGLRVNDKTYSRAWGGTIDGLRPGPIRLVRRDLMLLLLIQLIDVYTIVVLAAVVLTWIRLSPRNPVLQFVHMVNRAGAGSGPPDYSAAGRTGHLADAGHDCVASDSLRACSELLISSEFGSSRVEPSDSPVRLSIYI